MDYPINYMDKTMIHSEVSFYDNVTPWDPPGRHFLIRGLALNELMPPALICHGEKAAYPWPWLLIFFDDPVVLNSGTPEEMRCEKSIQLWPPRTVHRYGNPSASWNHSWIIFDGPEIEEYLAEFPVPTGVPVAADAGRIFAKYLTLLRDELTRSEPDLFLQRQLVKLFLYELHRSGERQPEAVPLPLQRIRLYILNNFTEELSLETLAARFHLSVPHLSAAYRKSFRISPMSHINRLRMEHAAKLLRLYPYSCKEVASFSGFHDPLYFSRRFHQYWGVSPREYRKQNMICSASRKV